MTTKSIGWKSDLFPYLLRCITFRFFVFVNDLKNSDFLNVGLPLQDTVGITTIVSKSAALKSLHQKTLMNKTLSRLNF